MQIWCICINSEKTSTIENIDLLVISLPETVQFNVLIVKIYNWNKISIYKSSRILSKK